MTSTAKFQMSRNAAQNTNNVTGTKVLTAARLKALRTALRLSK